MSAPTSTELPIWLAWLETLHIKNIDMSLERINEVAARLAVNTLSCPVITIGGTNGKGSCVAALESIYLKGGYRVGAYTSPHLFHFNERIRINENPVSDQDIVQAFQQIEAQRGSVTLTFFEYTTLAALLLFKHSDLDVVLLEVGLGGRLDAVNIIDADVAIITTIALDHTDWLGNTRELIAFEKAGIFRHKKIVICGDFDPPEPLISEAVRKQCDLYCQGKDFRYEIDAGQESWSWQQGENKPLRHLYRPRMVLQNISTALMAYFALARRLPVSHKDVLAAIPAAHVIGRFETIRENPLVIVDVAHNPAAAMMLSEQINQKLPSFSRIVAVFSALDDKDIVNIVRAVSDQIAEWYIAPLPTPRSCLIGDLEQKIRQGSNKPIHIFDTISQAYQQALLSSTQSSCILVFGSFYTVAEVRKRLNK